MLRDNSVIIFPKSGWPAKRSHKIGNLDGSFWDLNSFSISRTDADVDILENKPDISELMSKQVFRRFNVGKYSFMLKLAS